MYIKILSISSTLGTTIQEDYKSTTIQGSEKVVKLWHGAKRQDGFPALVGITCYFCQPEIFLNESDPNVCKIQNGQENQELGKNITCTHGYDKDGVLVPPRGCLSGTIGNF